MDSASRNGRERSRRSFHGGRQCHIIDEAILDRVDSADPLQCLARISTVPPAAAATDDDGSLTLVNGYSI